MVPPFAAVDGEFLSGCGAVPSAVSALGKWRLDDQELQAWATSVHIL